MKKIKVLLLLLTFSTILINGCKKSGAYNAEKQAEIDEQLIKDFLTSKNITNAERDKDTGIYYIVSSAGSGDVSYQSNTSVKFKYSLSLLNGQSLAKDSQYSNLFSQLPIIGLQIGISKIKPGGKVRLLIPSGYGFGPREQSGIPANSVLDYYIELLEVGY